MWRVVARRSIPPRRSAPGTRLRDRVGRVPAARKKKTGHAALYEHTRKLFDLEAGPLLRTLDAVAAAPDVRLSGLEPR